MHIQQALIDMSVRPVQVPRPRPASHAAFNPHAAHELFSHEHQLRLTNGPPNYKHPAIHGARHPTTASQFNPPYHYAGPYSVPMTSSQFYPPYHGDHYSMPMTSSQFNPSLHHHYDIPRTSSFFHKLPYVGSYDPFPYANAPGISNAIDLAGSAAALSGAAYVASEALDAGKKTYYSKWTK